MNLDLPGYLRPTADILRICQILCHIASGVKKSSVNGQERIFKWVDHLGMFRHRRANAKVLRTPCKDKATGRRELPGGQCCFK